MSVVGLDWARAVIDGGSGWSLLSWTAVFSIAFAVAGFFVGRAFGTRSLKEVEKRRDVLIEENEKLHMKARTLESENEKLKSDLEGRDGKTEKSEEAINSLKTRQLDMEKVPGISAAINTLAKKTEELLDSSGPSSATRDTDDPLSKLLPTEIPFLLRVYDEAQAHVGMENLKVAQSLNAKGAVARTDAPESGVISQCDVALTDKWAEIMNARADELRARI